MSYKIETGGLRLPLINSEEIIDSLSYLSEDEKEFGKRNLSMVPPTDGWAMLGNDPDMQAFWQVFERELTSMMDGDMQVIPFGFMTLANLVIARHAKDEYNCGTMAAALADSVVDFGVGYIGTIKLCMIDFPDCSCWNDEERLAIKFVKAFIEYKMTDEIFQEAIDRWGEKMVVRRMSWICYVNGMVSMCNAMGMRYPIEKEIFPYGTWTPENVKMTTGNLAGSYERVREMWQNMNAFVSGEAEAREKAAAQNADCAN